MVTFAYLLYSICRIDAQQKKKIGALSEEEEIELFFSSASEPESTGEAAVALTGVGALRKRKKAKKVDEWQSRLGTAQSKKRDIRRKKQRSREVSDHTEGRYFASKGWLADAIDQVCNRALMLYVKMAMCIGTFPR